MSERFPKLETSQLKLGMFVAELDRSWLDTPFLIQGVLAESNEDIDTFRRLCRYVYVDPARSTCEFPRVVSPADEPVRVRAPGRPQEPVHTREPVHDRETVHVREPVRVREPVHVREFVDSNERARAESVMGPSSIMAERVPAPRTLLQAGAPSESKNRPWISAASNATLSNAKHPHAPFAPPGVKLVTYRDEIPFDDELPRASKFYDRAQDVFARFARDIQQNGGLRVAEMESSAHDLAESIVSNPDALLWMTRLRGADAHAYGHGLRAGIYLLTLGRHLGFPLDELRQIAMIGMLLDVGKIKVPRGLLDKEGKLTVSEFVAVKKHVEYGLEILADAHALSESVLIGIAHHHERLDGSGYPLGLPDQEISMYGRMAALVDSFSAMISTRPYADAQAPGDVLVNLRATSGAGFHAPLLEQFIQAVGIFPVGSLVELSSGHVAIVVRQNRVRRLQPRLLFLTDSKKTRRDPPVDVDLMRQPKDASGELIRILRGLPTGAFGIDTNAYFGSSAEKV